jgi:hypothetical protein
LHSASGPSGNLRQGTVLNTLKMMFLYFRSCFTSEIDTYLTGVLTAQAVNAKIDKTESGRIIIFTLFKNFILGLLILLTYGKK